MSMQFDAVSRPRSMSAKVGPSRNSRPISGMTTTTIRMPNKNLKTQLITSIYHGKQKSPGKRGQNKNLLYTGISTEELAKFKRTSNIQITKEKQQLYEENIQLKREINRVSEQLAIVKSKSQNKSKKLLSKQKQLDRQFEKQLYWGGSKTHLISGIKHQYEKLKNDHINLRKQYGDLKKALIQSSVPEYKIYSEAIEIENKRLAEKIRKIAETTQLTLQNMHPDKEVTLAMLAQSEQNKLKLQQKLIQLDIQLRNANETLKDRDKKIEFLQKLIIEKDNKQFHIGRKLKRTEKSKEQLQEVIIGLKQRINEVQRQGENSQRLLSIEFQQIKNKQEQKYNIEIDELNQRVRSLEQENRVLELAVNKLRMSNSNIVNNSNAVINTNRSVNNPSSANIRKNNNSPIAILVDKKQSKNFDSTQSKNLVQESEKQRMPKRADKKRSQSSKKMRKVDVQEVKEIGQLIKYRMINLSISSQELKQYFSYKEEKSSLPNTNTDNQADNEWRKNYINMQEVQHIIRSSPFNLDQDYVLCLSRYLIEDCHLQYVYCDSENENTRDIVKSIIKTLVGNYDLPDQSTISKGQQFLNKYEMNLESVLKTYYPGGKISKRKFLDTIKGLGVEVQEAVGEYLVAKASRKSFRMDQILYNHLFLKDAK